MNLALICVVLMMIQMKHGNNFLSFFLSLKIVFLALSTPESVLYIFIYLIIEFYHVQVLQIEEMHY
jgi:hypothetical protein